MDPISLAEYAAECKSIAQELVKECEGDEKRISDSLHNAIDGHQWIIYTYYNCQVLTHSRNDNAYFKNFGPLTADSFSDAVAKMAFAALEADVQAELSDALEAYRNPPTFYVTSFCNQAHRLVDGKPIRHECRIIPPAALEAERAGDTDKAIELMKAKPAKYMRRGVRK